MPPINQANSALAPVFNQANQAIAGQTPAIQNLYQALIGGLQAQQGAQIQNVVQSAEARGVGRAGLAGDVQAQLGQELALATGQLGLQQAQDISGARQAAGQLSTERGTRVVDLATSLQDTSLQEKQARIQRQKTEKQHQLDIQQANRQFEVRKAAYAKAQAEKAAAQATQQKTLLDLSGEDLERMTRLQLQSVQGGDGFVSPENLAKAYNDYKNAGFSAEDFWSRFQGKWNPNQSDYADKFFYHVNRGT